MSDGRSGSVSAGWFRVPVAVAKLADGTAPVSRQVATIDLLSRWHLGDNPGVRELMRVWCWGAGRTMRHIAEVRAWAAENDARMPAKAVDVSRYGTPAEHPERATTPTTRDQRNGSGTSHARVPSARQKRERREANGGTADATAAPSRPVEATTPSPPPLPDFGAVFFTSTQTAERLIRAGVDTTEKLIAMTRDEVRYLPGIGSRIGNVEACLRQHGLALATAKAKPDPLSTFLGS